MATVTSQLTRIHDLEGTPTITSIGGGAGGSANTDVFLQGAQSVGRRCSNATLKGFWITDAAANDISAAGIHLGMWIWVTHYGVITDLEIWMGASQTNYDRHDVPVSSYPKLGGWYRVWLDVSRTPENVGGTGGDETAMDEFALVVSIPTVGGTSDNVIMDAIDHCTAGLLLTGTSGLWSDFTTADENTTNQYGVLRTVGGVLNCLARLTLGSSSSLAFSDAGTIIFPDQPLVAVDFMGVTCDLQHASTAITLTGGAFVSSGTKRGDFVVTGTSGVLTVTGRTFDAMRLITLTSACSLTGCVFNRTGQVTAAGADLRDSVFSGYEGTADTSLLVWNVNTDPDGLLDDTTFTKGTAATHAIEFGTSSPTTMTLSGIAFSGYNAANGNNDSTIHVRRTTGTVTINLVGCSGNISYKTDGAAVVFVVDPVTLTVTAKNVNTGANVQGAHALVLAAAGGPYPADASVTITRSGSTATVAHTGHGLSTSDKVRIKGANEQEYNGVYTITVTGVNEYTYAVSGTPATPATGTIVSSLAIIDALTNASGQVSDTRSYSSDQPFTGVVRKGTAGTVYKSSPVTGTVDNLAGASATVQLIPDS